MKIPRIMIAAPKSGSGKTLITCALLRALKKENIDVMAFKCGPDYIDPMFHRTVQEVPAENLDTFFSDEVQTKQLFLESANGHEMVVMEGVMGLFDGLGGIQEEGSSYHLAKVTKTPVILVVDVHGMGKSMIPLIQGFLQYDREHLIRGVILNKISEGFFGTMQPLLKRELPVPVLGYFANQKELHLESRHLGLKLPEEVQDIKAQLDLAAKQLTGSVPLQGLLEIAEKAENIGEDDREKQKQTDEKKIVEKSKVVAIGAEISEKKETDKKLILAVARDAAFCFYYAANLREFEKHGVGIRYFSPLQDETLPEGCSGTLLGGGYPELYAEQLSKNTAIKMEIKQAIARGMPSLAECGGFMYLHQLMEDMDGVQWPMVGVIDGTVKKEGRLVRFGYVEIKENLPLFLRGGETIRGHEFHYYDSTKNGADCTAIKPVNGCSWQCVHEGENHFWGFPHLYYPSAPEFVARFVERMKQYQESTTLKK